jgi:uncharacterized protein (TIGR02300 family)
MPPHLYLTGPEGRVRKRANSEKAVTSVAKPELGTKRVCPTTGRKFYDMNKDPIISPYTGMVVPVAVAPARGRPAEVKAAAAPVAAAEPAAVEEAEVETVSLEDADEEAAETGKKVTGGEDIDIEDEEIPVAGDDDDDTFLEADEDEEVDAAELIDGEVGGDEET